MQTFTREEIKRNLLGSLEISLFMPAGHSRFGDTFDEAVRSFIIPILLFPATILALYFYPESAVRENIDSMNTISLLLSLRLAVSWAIFFGAVYWIVKKCDRQQHFYRFVIAMNWLTVPATVIFIPVAWMLIQGTHSWQELYGFMLALTFYSYAFTAYMTSRVLIIPMELAAFIIIVGMCVNDSTINIVNWVGGIL